MKLLQKSMSIFLILAVMAVFSLQPSYGQGTGYGVDGSGFPNFNWVSLPIPAGTPVTTVGPTTANSQGGDFITLFQTGFFTTQSGTLVTVIAALGTAIPLAPVTGINANQSIIGMGFDLSTATMYLATTNLSASGSELYTIDLGTGVASFIGQVSNAPILLAIAVDCNGNIFGFDDQNDNLVGINPATGAGTIIGSLGVDAGLFAQDADFDPETGILYWTHFNGSSGELRTVDVNSGNSTLVTTWSADLISFGIFGDCEPTGLDSGSGAAPRQFELFQNYPNPFNPSTTFRFTLSSSSEVRLTLFNPLGQEVARLIDRRMSPGSHTVEWNAGSFPSGTYLYRLSVDGQSTTRQLVLMK